MKRLATSCVIIFAALLMLAPVDAAMGQVVKVKVDAINPYEYLVTPAPTGTMPISTGLSVVPKRMRVYFMADTTGSNANVVSSFAWTITSVPPGSAVVTGSLNSTTAMKTSFIPDTVGDYTIQVVAGGKTATKTISAATFVGTKVDQDCGLCHIPGSKAKTAFDQWKTSRHATMFKRGVSGQQEVEVSYDGVARGAYNKSCIKCHTTGWDALANNNNFGYLAHIDNGGVKAWDTTWYKDPANAPAQGEFFIKENDTTNWTNLKTSYPQLQPLATIGCEQCHGPASLHSTGQFSKIDKSFESGVCDPCHTASTKHGIGRVWEKSAHAILAEGSHTAQSGCYPCHSGKAFVQWTNNKATPGYDSTSGNVKINCTTCHDPHTMTLRATSIDSLRNGYHPPAGLGGAGLLCANCHNSRYSVKVRVTNNAPYYGFTNRFGPHENGQADIFFGSNGYQYGDSTLTGLMSHYSLEDGCVTCHMVKGLNASSPTQSNHEMRMLDTLGHPTVAGLKACAPCHGEIEDYDEVKAFADYDQDGKIEGLQSEVQGLLDRLKAKLPKDASGNPITMTVDSLKIKGNQRAVQDLWNYHLVNNDGTRGIHNAKYAVALLQKALDIKFTGVKAVAGQVPNDFALNQNYPNPFNPTTNITFSLPAKERVKIEVFDVLGNIVKTVVDTDMPAGNYQTSWDATDASGKKVATGMYLYRMTAGQFSTAKKMLLVK